MRHVFLALKELFLEKAAGCHQLPDISVNLRFKKLDTSSSCGKLPRPYPHSRSMMVRYLMWVLEARP